MSKKISSLTKKIKNYRKTLQNQENEIKKYKLKSVHIVVQVNAMIEVIKNLLKNMIQPGEKKLSKLQKNREQTTSLLIQTNKTLIQLKNEKTI